MKIYTLAAAMGLAQMAQAQTPKASATAVPEPDTIATQYLPELTVVGRGSRSDYQAMPAVVGTNIYAGKKAALLVLDNVQGNAVMNNMRQVMAKIPGIQIWESDPSGIQIGIAARGLSPNRSWEFNVRQNGYDISADPFGYPEAYYNPQLQAVQRIEVVRGAGALQYGPQFGGMVNYIVRNGSDITKPLAFETQQTVGSNGLFNSFNAVGGSKGKAHYYAYFDHRSGNGWRQNSRFYSNAGFATFSYQLSQRFKLTVEMMQWHMRSQQPGGLTDSMLMANAQASVRHRNWFDLTWSTPAVTADFQINQNTRWVTKLFATLGNRSSVGFMQPVTVADTINRSTGQFSPRLLNIDRYRNLGLESRLITQYRLGKMQHSFTAGLRAFTGQTHRLTDGKGSTGTGYDMEPTGLYPRDIRFRSNNLAAFVETMIKVTDRLTVVPGLRYEWLQGNAQGRNGFNAAGEELVLQNVRRSRSFLLAGLGAEYRLTPTTALYANYTQAYRPIQFAQLQAPPTTDVIDENLSDARGYNLDIGYRGKVGSWLQFDLSAFWLQYNNRVGAITLQNTSGVGPANFRFVTNVGASTNRGVESFVELNLARAFRRNTAWDLVVFGSYGFLDARYNSEHKDAATKGKKVENAPDHIVRSGLSIGYKKWMLTGQFSHVSSTFSDANNTVAPTANAQAGLIPAYTVADLHLSAQLPKGLTLRAGVNNLFNETYFTRRAGGYPGPGALPADGRTAFLTIGARF